MPRLLKKSVLTVEWWGHTEEYCWKKYPQLKGSSGSWPSPKGGYKGDYKEKGKGNGKAKEKEEART